MTRTTDLRLKTSHPPQFFPGTSAARILTCRLRAGRRCNRQSSPCQAWQPVSAQNRALDRYAETAPVAVSPTRSLASAQRKIHPACTIQAVHVRFAALRRYFSLRDRLQVRRRSCQPPRRSPCLTRPMQSAAPPPASQNSRYSISPGAAR